VYLYGAWAFPEGVGRGDVDLQVIVGQALSDSEKSALGNLHNTLAQQFPSVAGDGLDAYYILLIEARGTTPPRHQLLPDVIDSSWALHRAHILAGRCIVLYGPDPRGVYTSPSWEDLETALESEHDYVRRHLRDYPAYCVLNLCRLIQSYATRNVVLSKYGSAKWAREVYPQSEPIVDAALRVYEKRATTTHEALLGDKIGEFYEFACGQMRRIRGEGQAA